MGTGNTAVLLLLHLLLFLLVACNRGAALLLLFPLLLALVVHNCAWLPHSGTQPQDTVHPGLGRGFAKQLFQYRCGSAFAFWHCFDISNSDSCS